MNSNKVTDMKNILVTGGNGFIGQHVCQYLRDHGMEPKVFANRAPADFLGDTRDYTSVSEAVAVTDGVIHLAGVLGTQETIREPQPAVETNIFGGLNVFKACAHYNKRAVYIAVGNHWMNNTYSITKTTAERFAFMFNKEMGTKIAVVRGLNAYGPGQKPGPVRKIMPNFILPALRGESITVYGDGGQIMDMVWVGDLAETLVRALTQDHGQWDKPFECGTGRRTTVKQIAEAVVREVQRAYRTEPPIEDYIQYVPMRPGEPEQSVVLGNPGTLAPLGINPENLVSLESGIARTIRYYFEQEQARDADQWVRTMHKSAQEAEAAV